MPEQDEFETIVDQLKAEMPDPDPLVRALLMDGTVLVFHEISAKALAYKLATRGFAEMADAKGTKCFLYAHGVAAVLGYKEQPE